MKRLLIAGLTVISLGLGIGYLNSLNTVQPPTLAKHGADDPAGDDRGGKGRGKDDGLNHASKGSSLLVKHGADDPAGDDRGGKGRGKDDGLNHASTGGKFIAKHGADDPAGDDRGRGGHGPNHT